MSSEEIIEKELSTGLIIAGAYANKLRRTLFAQLRDYIKQNRDFAREVARASGEMNRLLYVILVVNLKCDKGDVVRIRVKYSFDPKNWKITWYYDTLRIEYFKRQPDEQVNEVVRRVIEEKLAEIKEQYREAPPREEAEKILRGEAEVPGEEWTEEKGEKTLEVMGTTQPIIEKIEGDAGKEGMVGVKIASADPIGETLMGGIIFRLADEKGENIGIASIEPHAGGWVIESIVLHEGKAYRTFKKAPHNKEEYLENPGLLVEELNNAKFVEISKKDAEQIIRSKMEELT